MPIPVAAGVWAFIVTIIVPLLVKLLVALGVGFITYTGIDIAAGNVQTFIENQFSGVPGYMLQLIGILQLDTAISMVIAAYAASFSVRAVSGSLTRLSLGRSGNSVGV